MECLADSEYTLYTNGSSFAKNGQNTAGHDVVTTKVVLLAGPFLQNWSAQSAELLA